MKIWLKNSLWAFGVLMILLVIGSFVQDEKDNQELIGSVINEVVSENQSEKILKENYFVISVIDGDTIKLDNGEVIRLICIDTPESSKEGFLEAKTFLRDLILNKTVILEKDVSETDFYDRLLRYVYLEDGTFVNELMVKKGFGVAYPYGKDIRYCPIIQEAEKYAKENQLGIWEPKVETSIEERTEEIFEEQKVQPSGATWECSSNIYNCDSFSTHIEAQEAYESCGGINNDVHQLDKDKDGLACESLP